MGIVYLSYVTLLYYVLTMIILFAYKGSFLDLVYYLSKNWDKQFKILDRFNKYYFTKAKCIIPFGIGSQIILNQYPEYKHKYLVCDNEIYNKLNDKILFYNFIKKSKLLDGSDIKLIKTYTKKYKGPNIKRKFIIKHKKGAGSSRNKIIEDYIYTLIQEYADTCQIQDVIDIDNINGINGLSNNGKVVYMLDFKMPSFVDGDYYHSDKNEVLDQVDPKLGKIVSKIIKKN